jgi:hypothetical protein
MSDVRAVIQGVLDEHDADMTDGLLTDIVEAVEARADTPHTCGSAWDSLRAENERLRALLDRDRLVAVLKNEGLGDGGQVCSWRCSEGDRYPGWCHCVDDLVDLIVGDEQ